MQLNKDRFAAEIPDDIRALVSSPCCLCRHRSLHRDPSSLLGVASGGRTGRQRGRRRWAGRAAAGGVWLLARGGDGGQGVVGGERERGARLEGGERGGMGCLLGAVAPKKPPHGATVY